MCVCVCVCVCVCDLVIILQLLNISKKKKNVQVKYLDLYYFLSKTLQVTMGLGGLLVIWKVIFEHKRLNNGRRNLQA